MRIPQWRVAAVLVVPIFAACVTSSRGAAQDTLRQAVMVTWDRLRAYKTGQDTTQTILKYGQSLRPSEFDTTVERGDRRRLMVGTCPDSCSFGPFARIEPRVRAAQRTRAQRDAGDIIARIISDGPYHPAGKDTVYKFNIHGRDTVYWWVGIGKRADSLVSIFVSTARESRPLVSNLVQTRHDPGFWKGLALARWIWNDKDDEAWGTCDGQVCCKSNGLELQ